MKSGYLYIATGDSWIKEAAISAESLRQVDPAAQITLVAGRESEQEPFDQVLLRPARCTKYQEAHLYKIRHMYADSPYDQTLFMDTDTYFYESAAPLFRLLDFYDVCMAHDPISGEAGWFEEKQVEGYTPYNSGVILFSKGPENQKLFSAWLEIYERKLNKGTLGRENDQTSFMEALLTCQSRVCVLPNVWNARIPFYLNLVGKVKIVHGRHPDYERLERQINVTEAQRGWDPIEERCLFREFNASS